MAVAGNGQFYPMRAARRDWVKLRALVAIGTTGAPTLTGDHGITIARDDTGDYDITFPVFPTGSGCVVKVGVALSAAATVTNAVVTALDTAAGTATFLTTAISGDPGEEAAADPADGDVLWIEIEGSVSLNA